MKRFLIILLFPLMMFSQDTTLVGDVDCNGEVNSEDASLILQFITKFDDFADANIPFMYHCHMLVHEDEGMMGQFTVVDDGSTGVETLETEIFSIYPNPANDKIKVKLKNSINQEIQIIDVKGKLILESTLNTNEGNIDVSHLNSGVYFIKTTNKNFKFFKL